MQGELSHAFPRGSIASFFSLTIQNSRDIFQFSNDVRYPSTKGDDEVLVIVCPVMLTLMILTAFFLGSCAGFLLARKKNDRENDSQRGAIRGDVNEGIIASGTRLKKWGASGEMGGGGSDDGPTMVLRGALDLMASKWGGAVDSFDIYNNNISNAAGRSLERNKNDSSPACNEVIRRGSSGRSKVVEYLSPMEMSRLLFAKINADGGNLAETFRLDSYFDDSKNEQNYTVDPTSPLVGPSTLNNSDQAMQEKTSLNDGQYPKTFIQLLSLIQRYSVDTSHPYFFNQLFGSLDPIALAAEIVALSVNTSVFTYETAPVFTLMEREVLNQLGKLVFGNHDDPSEVFRGDGLMLPGGSLANLSAMHAARQRWKAINGFHEHSLKERAAACSRNTTFTEASADRFWSEEQGEEKKIEDIPNAPVPRFDRHHSSPQRRSSPRDAKASFFPPFSRQSSNEERDMLPDLVAFVSSEAHYSFVKSARVLGLHIDDLIVIPTHSDGRMDVKALAKRIEELEIEFGNQARVTELPPNNASPGISKKRIRVPFFVACTAGSTVRGSFDDIAEIVKVCRDYESRGNNNNHNHELRLKKGAHYERAMWIHVDGAWGGSAIFSSRSNVRSITRMDEIRYADSFTFNPHKMLGAPQQTTAFIVRHRNALRDANAAGARYLFDPRKNGAEYDLGDLSYTCGRRTDVVKLWALWKYYGRAGLGSRVDHKVDMLHQFVREVRRRSSFALACKPWPFNVNFFYLPPRIRNSLKARSILTEEIEGKYDENDTFLQVPDDIAEDLAAVSVKLKLRLHEAGEMLIPYQPLSNQKADCFRLVLAGKKDFDSVDICHILDTMERYGSDL